VWDLKNIESIYGTSIGSIFAVIVSLGYDWETLDDYIIKRPWQNVFNFNMQNIFAVFHKRGIFDVKILEETFLPLFKGKDIDINIALKGFYEMNHIEMHFFSVNINDFSLVDFSYKTHPEWRLVDAVFASCGLPILFQPIIEDNICYSDGGMMSNYPVSNCINNGADPETIFGICRKPILRMKCDITSESSLFDYIINIFYKTIERVLNNQERPKIKHEIYVHCPPLSISDVFDTSSKMEERMRLVQLGTDSYIKEFFSNE
jgi:predicted acylesterase/phospholipase RssA